MLLKRNIIIIVLIILSTTLINASLSDIKHEILTRNGIKGVWVPEVDYRLMMSAFDTLPGLNRQIGLLNQQILFLNEEIKMFKNISNNKWKLQAIGFRISTEILTISFISSLTFLCLYMGWNYLNR